MRVVESALPDMFDDGIRAVRICRPVAPLAGVPFRSDRKAVTASDDLANSLLANCNEAQPDLPAGTAT